MVWFADPTQSLMTMTILLPLLTGATPTPASETKRIEEPSTPVLKETPLMPDPKRLPPLPVSPAPLRP